MSFERLLRSRGILCLFLGVLCFGGGEIGCQMDSGEGSSPNLKNTTQENRLTEAQTPAVADSMASPREIEVPAGMVYVPSGSTRIGIDADQWRQLRSERSPGPRHMFGRDAHPPFTAHVDSFLLDVHPVTVAQFRRFVRATDHTTQAEEFGDAGVLREGEWQLVKGATWHHPLGADEAEAPDDHPVTQVSWNDAKAYCEWADKRLPTEVEWEHAARGGQNRRAFCPWEGDCRDSDVRIASANTWQGRYPIRNTVADGYRYTSPVGAFGSTDLGLQDMSGNVWEWTDSWHRPYDERDSDFQPTAQSERVQRGGSFICSECGGYYVFARSSASPETSLFHVGFRCARDPAS